MPTATRWLLLPQTRVNKVSPRVKVNRSSKVYSKDQGRWQTVPVPALAKLRQRLNKPKLRTPISNKWSNSKSSNKLRLLPRVMLTRPLSKHNRLRRNIMLLRRICKIPVLSVRVKRGQSIVLGRVEQELMVRPNGNGPDHEQNQKQNQQNQNQPNSAGVCGF